MLRIHDVALELVREGAPLAREIARHDAGLAKQFRDAMSSVPLNVSEGCGAQGGRKNGGYHVALGSARRR